MMIFPTHRVGKIFRNKKSRASEGETRQIEVNIALLYPGSRIHKTVRNRFDLPACRQGNC